MREPPSDAIVNTVAGVIGMIPEGLVLLTSVSFILGVGRLARKQALVQEMEAIEALARVNVLCPDKTGTITTGDLEVVEVVPCGTMSDEKIREVMNEITFAFNDVNPTQQALMNYFEKTQKWQTTDLIPFSSARKYRAIAFGEHGAYVLGAPEFIAKNDEELLKKSRDLCTAGLSCAFAGGDESDFKCRWYGGHTKTCSADCYFRLCQRRSTSHICLF